MYFHFLFFSAVKDGDVGHIYVFLVQIVTSFLENIFQFRLSLGFEKTFSIGAPEKGEDEVGEDDEEGVEGRHHVPTLPVHTLSLEKVTLEQYLKILLHRIYKSKKASRMLPPHCHTAMVHGVALQKYQKSICNSERFTKTKPKCGIAEKES